jgi:hypothetical protein
MNRKKILLIPVTGMFIAVIALICFVGCSGQPDEIYAELGQPVELRLGQTVTIKGEQLEIKFSEVIEDSRCPTGAACIWEGQVTLALEIAYQDELFSEKITQPGLTSDVSFDLFKEYILEFNILPYPEVNEKISPEEYRLEILVNPAPPLSGGILVTFDVEGEKYRVFVKNESAIDDIYALQRGESQAAIPSGRIIAEPVFYNQPWSWHIDPMDIQMAEFTIEVCSGLPSHVENDLDYWVNSIQRFCPWSAKIVEIVDRR